jgi:multiple sugar transport system permease protein
MTEVSPPTGRGALAKREARLAWGLLFPTIAIVSIVIVLPLLAIFWISFKPVGLSDLRPVAPVVRESLRSSGDDFRIEYRVRNSSQDKGVQDVGFSDVFPPEVTLGALSVRRSGARL